jgi:predicted DNA-binding WGR domain protein
MEKYYRFSEENSDKYREVEYNETKSVVFFGRIGSAGRTEEKIYSSEEECKKAVEKQIASKLKKGYKVTETSNRPIKDAETPTNIKEFEDDWDIKVSPVSKILME